MASSVIQKALNGDISSLNDDITQFKGVQVDNGTDLDTLTTAGNYYNSSGTNTYPHAPEAGAFTLQVYRRGSRANQIYTVSNTSGAHTVYIRISMSSGWSAWNRFVPDGRIGRALAGNSTVTIDIDYTVGHRILFLSHSSNTSIRGIYVLRGASAPLCVVASTGVTIDSYTATSITLTNNTANSAGVDIL